MNTIQRKPPINALAAQMLQAASKLQQGDLSGVSADIVAEHNLTDRDAREAYASQLTQAAHGHARKRREGGD